VFLFLNQHWLLLYFCFLKFEYKLEFIYIYKWNIQTCAKVLFFSSLSSRFDKKLLRKKKKEYLRYLPSSSWSNTNKRDEEKERSIFYVWISFPSDFSFSFLLFFGIKYMRRRRRRICIGTTIAILYICVWVRVRSKNENEVVFIIRKKGKSMLERLLNLPYWKKEKRERESIEWHSCAFRS